MSTPNPTHIIAEHAFGSRWEVSKPAGKRVSCACEWVHRSDGWFNGDTDLEARAIHAEHVVSKLTDAGYSIMPSDGIVRTYQAASTLGHRYMSPKTFGCDREEAERWFKLHQSALDGLPGVDTVRLEYRDEYVTGWLPLLAEGEKP